MVQVMFALSIMTQSGDAVSQSEPLLGLAGPTGSQSTDQQHPLPRSAPSTTVTLSLTQWTAAQAALRRLEDSHIELQQRLNDQDKAQSRRRSHSRNSCRL